ncbi:hypothetical protein J4Q44_G00261650 [Coregonus suidteri]|uniref:Uncharacterized protein n=1 Tax=Coregonus suidteri TaxID=861788 RepID=A0AAN8QLU8_9TELE
MCSGCVLFTVKLCRSVCGVTDCFVLPLSLCKNNQCFSKVIRTIAGELTSVHQLHYMTKSMWTPAHRTSHSKIMGINIELVPPFAAITASTLLGRLSTRCLNIASGTCFHSATSISEVAHRCWAIRPGSQSVLQFIPKVFDGVEVRALCRPVKFFHTDLDKPYLYGPCFVHGHCLAETGKGLPQTVATKLEAQNHLECHSML